MHPPTEYEQAVAYLVSKAQILERVEKLCRKRKEEASGMLASGYDSQNPKHAEVFGKALLADQILRMITGE